MGVWRIVTTGTGPLRQIACSELGQSLKLLNVSTSQLIPLPWFHTSNRSRRDNPDMTAQRRGRSCTLIDRHFQSQQL